MGKAIEEANKKVVMLEEAKSEYHENLAMKKEEMKEVELQIENVN